MLLDLATDLGPLWVVFFFSFFSIHPVKLGTSQVV